VGALYEELEVHARMWAREHAIPEAGTILERRLHARYRGQSHQLSIAVPASGTPLDVARLAATFHRAHRDAYGYDREHAVVDVVDFHVTLIAAVPRPELAAPTRVAARSTAADARIEVRPARFRGHSAALPADVYDRTRLPADSMLRGPAILEQLDSTTVVPPDATATVDRWGNVRIELR
jgi:N-methylhydantoinase A